MENVSLQHPYIPNTVADRQEMLKAIGVSSVRELFQDIPEGYRQSSLEHSARFVGIGACSRAAGPCRRE